MGVGFGMQYIVITVMSPLNPPLCAGRPEAAGELQTFVVVLGIRGAVNLGAILGLKDSGLIVTAGIGFGRIENRIMWGLQGSAMKSWNSLKSYTTTIIHNCLYLHEGFSHKLGTDNRHASTNPEP